MIFQLFQEQGWPHRTNIVWIQLFCSLWYKQLCLWHALELLWRVAWGPQYQPCYCSMPFWDHLLSVLLIALTLVVQSLVEYRTMSDMKGLGTSAVTLMLWARLIHVSSDKAVGPGWFLHASTLFMWCGILVLATISLVENAAWTPWCGMLFKWSVTVVIRFVILNSPSHGPYHFVSSATSPVFDYRVHLNLLTEGIKSIRSSSTSPHCLFTDIGWM